MKIFVFALLKPSQIYYKLVPLSHSAKVEKIYLLRKEPILLSNEKIECITLPKILRYRMLYLLFTCIYGAILIKKLKIDLIISYNLFPHGYNGFIASLFTGKRFIFCDINQDTIKHYNKPILNSLIKNLLNRAFFITVPGSRTEAIWKSQNFKNIIQLHSTIDTNIFYPTVGSKKIIDFIFIGEFDENKRPDIIINSFYKFLANGFKAKLCLIGFGKLESQIKNFILTHDLITSIEIVHSYDVLSYLQKSKIMVMASLHEGLPCAIMEAMACELVVIVPNVGNISDLVTNNVNGFIHDNTQDGIATAMQNAFEQYNQLNLIREAARTTIKTNHSFSVATRKWNSILNQI